MSESQSSAGGLQPRQAQVAVTSFVALFSIVGLALYGLPFYYDFMVREFGWSRTQVTSGNALSKLLVGPLFGFMAGWVVDRFGPRRLMMSGIVMAGVALIGLAHMTSLWMFYAFYLLNALGYVCGGPLPNQVLLSRWFDKARGKAMGFAYLGIGIGGYLVLFLSPRLVNAFGWRGALQVLGILIILLALPLAYFVRDEPDVAPDASSPASKPARPSRRWAASSATRRSTSWCSAACARSAPSAARTSISSCFSASTCSSRRPPPRRSPRPCWPAASPDGCSWDGWPTASRAST